MNFNWKDCVQFIFLESGVGNLNPQYNSTTAECLLNICRATTECFMSENVLMFFQNAIVKQLFSFTHVISANCVLPSCLN